MMDSLQALSDALADPALTADDLSKIVATGRSFRLPSGAEYEVPKVDPASKDAHAPEEAPKPKEAPMPKEALPTIQVCGLLF